jgi:hypothetical protein
MPFPLEDRQYVGTVLWERMDNGNFFVCSTTSPQPEYPPADGFVQINTTRAITIRQTGPRRSSVECVVHMDMGGAIPSWVNTRITVPTMKSVPISMQQYVCEEAAAVQMSTNLARAGTSRSSAPPPTSMRETGWSLGASSTTSCRRSGRTPTS